MRSVPLQILIKNNKQGTPYFIDVYNVFGEEVYSAKTNSQNTQISLNNSCSGLYLYRVLLETGDLVKEGKFIIH